MGARWYICVSEVDYIYFKNGLSPIQQVIATTSTDILRTGHLPET